MSGCALLCPANPAFADPEPLKGRAEVNWRYGTERSILMTDFWSPILQDEDSVLYADVRLMGDDQDNHEGNFGIGYRTITTAPILGKGVAGVNGWFDRRITENDSTFHQITLGAEWRGEALDILANGYIPLSDERRFTVPNTDPKGPEFAGTGIVVDTDGTALEEAQAGFDIEVGWELGQKIGLIREHTDAVRVYGGGYYFDGPNTENIAGWRVRVAADITPDVQIGARFQRDDERGSQGFLEATLRFPFGHKKSFRSDGLRGRLDDAPERDIDIVTGQKVVDTGDRVVVDNIATGSSQVVLHVDNMAVGGGDGSVEAPFNTLANAQAAATAHSIIYVHEGDGTSANQNTGITLNQTGQQLVGSGADFYYDRGIFATHNGNAVDNSSLLLAQATSAPVLSNIGGSGIRVIADDVKVAGLTVDGASTFGMDVDNVDNLSISNVILRNNTFDGLDAYYNAAGSSNSLILEGVTADNNGGRGLDIQTSSDAVLNVDVLDSITKNNASNGVFMQTNLTSQITGRFDNFLSDNDSDRSVYLNGYVSSRMSVDFSNSIIRNNTTGLGRGLQIQSNNESIVSVTASDSLFDANIEGVYIFSFYDAVTNIILRDSTIRNSVSRGLIFESYHDSTINADIRDNTITGSGNNGIAATVRNFSFFNGDFRGNRVTASGITGMVVTNYEDSQTDLDVQGNDFSSNFDEGFRLQTVHNSQATLSLVDNTANNNVGSTQAVGLQTNSSNTSQITSTISGNTANGNGHLGIYQYTQNTASLTTDIHDNVSNNNLQYGILVQAVTDTATATANIYNNSASGNFAGIALRSIVDTYVSGTISSNTVTGNTYGLLLQALNNGRVSAKVQGNTSNGNTVHGVFIDDDSSLASTVDLGGGVLGSTGNNRIFGNNSTEIRVDLDGGNLMAEGNWWGNPAGLLPAEVTLDAGSTIDADPFLIVDPEP